MVATSSATEGPPDPFAKADEAADAARQELRKLLFSDDPAGPSSATVDALVTSLIGPTARVVLPREEAMTLRLVSEHEIRRLDDAQAQAAFVWSVFNISLGAIISFFINLATGSTDVPALGWVILGLLTAVAGVFGLKGLLVSAKRNKLMKQMLEGVDRDGN